VVKEGRGSRLKGGDDVFSGLFWTGDDAIRLGLVDGLGDSDYVARDLIGAETTVNYTKKKDLLSSFADRLGTKLGEVLVRLTGGAYPLLR
jgi:protease-4